MAGRSENTSTQYGFVFLQKCCVSAFSLTISCPRPSGRLSCIQDHAGRSYKSRALSAVYLSGSSAFQPCSFWDSLEGVCLQDGSSSSHLALYYIVLVGSSYYLADCFCYCTTLACSMSCKGGSTKIKSLDRVIHNLTHISRNFPLLVYVDDLAGISGHGNW